MLATLSLGIFVIAQDRLYASVDSGLRSRARTIEGAVGPAPEPLTALSLQPKLAGLDRLASQGTSFRLYSTDGHVLYSSSGIQETALPRERSTPTLSTVSVDGARTRVLRQTFVSVGQAVGTIEVRESLAPTDSALSDIRLMLAAGAVGAIGLIAVLAYWIGGKFVSPVRQVSELAAAIQTTADFSRRLPDVPSPLEVRELSRTFNLLVERIEEMISAQRTFFAESSHELRRPLTLLQTNIDVLGLDDIPTAHRAKIRQEMRLHTASMSRLLSQLLLLARGDLGQMHLAVVNLSTVIEASLARSALAGHELSRDIESDIRVLGDEERLGHLVDNLIENACQYSSANGHITVAVKSVRGQAVLEVADSGTGMSKEELAKAFDRFFRGSAGREARPEGHGLGLSIVKHIAESHGGRVELESALGVGTICVVRLPLA